MRLGARDASMTRPAPHSQVLFLLMRCFSVLRVGGVIRSNCQPISTLEARPLRGVRTRWKTPRPLAKFIRKTGPELLRSITRVCASKPLSSHNKLTGFVFCIEVSQNAFVETLKNRKKHEQRTATDEQSRFLRREVRPHDRARAPRLGHLPVRGAFHAR